MRGLLLLFSKKLTQTKCNWRLLHGGVQRISYNPSTIKSSFENEIPGYILLLSLCVSVVFVMLPFWPPSSFCQWDVTAWLTDGTKTSSRDKQAKHWTWVHSLEHSKTFSRRGAGSRLLPLTSTQKKQEKQDKNVTAVMNLFFVFALNNKRESQENKFNLGLSWHEFITLDKVWLCNAKLSNYWLYSFMTSMSGICLYIMNKTVKLFLINGFITSS